MAKAKGVKFGRPAKPLPDNFYEVYQQWKKKKLTVKEAANACKLLKSTFYDYAKKLEES